MDPWKNLPTPWCGTPCRLRCLREFQVPVPAGLNRTQSADVVKAERNPTTNDRCTGCGGLEPWETSPLLAHLGRRLCTTTARPGAACPNGDMVVVCRRSGGSCRPHGCGKSPKVVAFAVPMWTRGYSSEDAWAVAFSRAGRLPRGRPPALRPGVSRPKPRRSDSVQSARSAAW